MAGSRPKPALNGMLQSLLEERFGLKAHRTPKSGRGFALIVARDGPRLTPDFAAFFLARTAAHQGRQ